MRGDETVKRQFLSGETYYYSIVIEQIGCKGQSKRIFRDEYAPSLDTFLRNVQKEAERRGWSKDEINAE